MLKVRWALGVLYLFSLSARAAFAPGVGYASSARFESAIDETVGGLEVVGDLAYFGVGTNVFSAGLSSTNVPSRLGSVPAPSTGASFLAMRAGDLHLAYSTNYNFPPSYRYGRISGGQFDQHGVLAGIYDGDVDAHGNLYLLAYPADFSGSRVYRYEPSTTSLTEVIFVGGYSGGIAFDSSNRLHVAEQNNGHVLRFTAEQLVAGNLVASDGQLVARVYASYLSFDHHNRLYAVSGFGNEIGIYDTSTTNKIRSIAVDDAGNYGIGWIKWNHIRRSLYVVYTDYYVGNNSTLYELSFASDSQGISHDSPLIKSWIVAYTNYHRPDPDSGGFAQDNNFAEATPGSAIIGKPASFTSEDVTAHVLSLGDGGSIELAFADTIVNGPGADFAVFENGFSAGPGTYAELAFVEVATTTNAWARFPTTFFSMNTNSEVATTLNVRQIDGFAGKHRIDMGTPFDLDWLASHTNVSSGAVNLSEINYIRLVDAPGNGTVADDLGNLIYDAAGVDIYAGFDLRGVGIINSAGLKINSNGSAPAMALMARPGRTYQMQYSVGHDVWINHGAPLTNLNGAVQVDLPAGLSGAMFRILQTVPHTP